MKYLKMFLVVALLATTGCASMSGYDQVRYQKLQAKLQKCELPELTPKSSATAGLLNILPGVGNAYLKQWELFALNLLLWPYSIVWGVPQAAADADNYNKQKTLNHYTYGFGKEELSEAGCE